MRINLILGILVIFIGLISCHKEDNIIQEDLNDTIPNEVIMYDTIKPLSYFPVYPGSFWKYRVIEKHYNISINDNDTVYTLANQDTSFFEMETESEYRVHNYITKSYYDYDSAVQVIEYSDSVYVSFLNGQPIYEYEKIDFASKPPFGETSYRKYPFLSETVGFEFLDGWYDSRHLYLGTYNEVIDKTIDLNADSVIIVYGYYNKELAPEYKLRRNEWKFYCKGIGLKLHYSFDERMSDTIYKKELIEYYINN